MNNSYNKRYNEKKYTEKRELHFGRKKLWFLICFFSAVLLSLVQNILIKTNYNIETGLFPKDSNALYFYATLAVTVIVFVLAMLLMNSNRFHKTAENSSGILRFFSGTCLVLLFGESVLKLFNAANVFGNKGVTFILLACVLSGIVASVYFAVIALQHGSDNTNEKISAVFGLLLVVHYIFRIISMYFNVRTSFNDPIWNLNNFAAISLMLYFLAETRYWIGKSIPKLHYAAACLAVILNICSLSASAIIFSMGTAHSVADILYVLFQASAVLYISTRILLR